MGIDKTDTSKGGIFFLIFIFLILIFLSRNNRSIGTRAEGNLTCMLIKFFLNFIDICKNLIKKYNWCFAIPPWLQTKV